GGRGYVEAGERGKRGEAGGAETDDRPTAGRGGATGGGGGARLGSGRIGDAVVKGLAHALHQVTLRAETEHVAADQADARIRRETVVECIDEGLCVALPGHGCGSFRRRRARRRSRPRGKGLPART